MPKAKTTITVDRKKIDEARRLTGATSASAAIEVALERLIRTERLRRDIAGYAAQPPGEVEIALAAIEPDWADLADDTNWAELYGEED